MTRVIAFGTFDYLHAGHIAALKAAKKLGSHLTVIISRDRTVLKYKKTRAKYTEQTRARRVRKLKIADAVRLGNLGDKFKIIERVKPDIIALGYDQRFFVNGLKQRFGGKIKIIRLKPYYPNIFKGSKLKNKIKRRFVAIFGIILNKNKIYLQLRRDYRPQFNNLWELPGGGLAMGESEEECLSREIKEETGLQIKVIKPCPGWYQEQRRNYRKPGSYEIFIKIYACAIVSGRVKLDNKEVIKMAWRSLNQAIQEKQAFPLVTKILKNNRILITKLLAKF
ncbi:MAG: NUDIX domain-containing protein [Candidatus Magasanikbacteria bacterium]|nr:NUDIX domain-containing protein [Candidatus Magasanikbacteria bacterium]